MRGFRMPDDLKRNKRLIIPVTEAEHKLISEQTYHGDISNWCRLRLFEVIEVIEVIERKKKDNLKKL